MIYGKMKKTILRNCICMACILLIVGCSNKFEKLIRQDNKQIVIDAKTKLMWQDDKNKIKKNWIDAKDYCNNLNFAEFSDWRLPKLKELLTITDDKINNLAVSPAFKNIVPKYYWSTTSHVAIGAFAWLVNFKSGNDGNAYKVSPYHVVCVRNTLPNN